MRVDLHDLVMHLLVAGSQSIMYGVLFPTPGGGPSQPRAILQDLH